MTIPLKYQWFADILNEAGYNVRSYSGRFMYGRSCLGFVVDDGTAMEALGEVLENITNGEHDTDKILDRVSDLGSLLRETRQDSMGLGTIVYFPSIAWNDRYESDWAPEDSEDEED